MVNGERTGKPVIYDSMKKTIVPMIVTALVLSAFTISNEDLRQVMNKMMQNMKSMKITGDPDKDFAMMMIAHHQGAIDAANIAVRLGKDEKIKSMAEKTLHSQAQEQEDLREHTQMQHDADATAKKDDSHAAHSQRSDANASSPHNEQFSAEMKSTMDEMDSKMKNMKMPADLDHAFATMMIDHHQAAIDMANLEGKHGRIEEVKAIAEKIVTDSQKDISELKTWLTSHDK